MAIQLSNVKGILDVATKELAKHSPSILSGLAISGVVTTAVMAAKASPKACYLIAEEERRLQAEIDWKRKIELSWELYIPTIVMGGATIACIVGSNNISARRTAALAGAYSITESALKDYQEKVKEVIGDNKETAIREEIAQDRLNAQPLSKSTILLTDKGKVICFDTLSSRYFMSDAEQIRRIENRMNHRLISENWCSVNDLYYELGLETTELGRDLGWSNETMIEIVFTTKLTDTDEPCLVMEFDVEPRYDTH